MPFKVKLPDQIIESEESVRFGLGAFQPRAGLEDDDIPNEDDEED